MPTYTWVGSVSTDANNSANWTPATTPTLGDTALFTGGNVNSCIWNIPIVSKIEITPDYDGTVDFSVNAEIDEGLSVEKESCITSSNVNTVIRFGGTPAYNSNTFYIEYKCSDMFFDAAAKDNILFDFGSSTIIMTPTGGVYPHCKFKNGFYAQYTAPPSSSSQTINGFQIKFQSIVIDGGNVRQSSATPTPDDRRMNFILDNVGSHASVAGASSSQLFMTTNANAGIFNGGYGTWTFQGSSGFRIPVTGNNFYNGYNFTFENMIIDSTANGSGAKATLAGGCILSLTNLTINNGACITGNKDGSIIHLINRPTINGTWGFYAIADGIYVSNRSYMLSVPHGGTGLTNVLTGAILFGGDYQKLNFDSGLTYSGNTLTVGVGGITFADGTNQTTAATGGGGGGIGVNVQDEGVALTTTATTLNFVDGQHPVQTVPTPQAFAIEATGTGAVKTITIDGSKIRTNATDTLPAYLDAKIQQGANMNITLDTTNAASTGHAFNFAADNNKVKISSADTTENFLENKLVAGSNITFAKVNAGGNELIEVSSTGGGGGGSGGYPLFKHDEQPSTHNFSPFRLLVDGDIIEIGVSSGGTNDADVSVFTPAQTIGVGGIDIITADNIGSGSTNTGREYIFYGQLGEFNFTNLTNYKLDTVLATGMKTFWIKHMSEIVLGGITPVGSELFIIGLESPSNVTVLDAGIHSIKPVDLSAEEPQPAEDAENCRLLLVKDHKWRFDKSGRLFPNFGFNVKDATNSKGGK